MKTHTLSLAIVGTLASSLVLSQAVLAEEVETATEATSNEEVMSDETVAESSAETASSDEVSESSSSESERSTNNAENNTSENTNENDEVDHDTALEAERTEAEKQYKDYLATANPQDKQQFVKYLKVKNDALAEQLEALLQTNGLNNYFIHYVQDIIKDSRNKMTQITSIENIDEQILTLFNVHWTLQNIELVPNIERTDEYKAVYELKTTLLNKLQDTPHVWSWQSYREARTVLDTINDTFYKLSYSPEYFNNLHAYSRAQDFLVQSRPKLQAALDGLVVDEFTKLTFTATVDKSAVANQDTLKISVNYQGLTLPEHPVFLILRHTSDNFHQVRRVTNYTADGNNLIFTVPIDEEMYNGEWHASLAYTPEDDSIYSIDIENNTLASSSKFTVSGNTERVWDQGNSKKASLNKTEFHYGDVLEYTFKFGGENSFIIGNIEPRSVIKPKFYLDYLHGKDNLTITRLPELNEYGNSTFIIHFTITEDMPEGSYTIGGETGNLMPSYDRFSNMLGFWGNAVTERTFTIKAKTQAETEKEEDNKTDEQPKVDNTTPEKQPETQADNATPEMKQSDNKKDEQPQVDNKPDNTTPEGKPSVDVKPIDMPTGTKSYEKKDKVTKEKIAMTTPSTSSTSTPTTTPAKPTSSAQALPETGELDSLFGLSALAILASVGLVAPAIHRREQ